MSLQAIKIEPDSDIRRVEIAGDTIEAQNDSIHEHLGGYFDIVRMGRDACMLVDDEGLLKNKDMNVLAMMISGYPMLVGTALIVGVTPTPDGDMFTDVPVRFVKLADDLTETQMREEETE